MPALVITNAALIRLIWTKSGVQYAINVLGALNVGAAVFNQTLANSVSAAIKSGFTTSGFATRVSTAIALSQVGVRSISAPNLPEYIGTGAAVAGTGVTHPLPGQTALCVTLRTNNAGPAYRGRIYLPGWTEDTNDTNGACDTNAADNGVAFVNAIDAALAANGLDFAVLSRPRAATTIPAKTISAKTGFGTPVTAVLVRDLVWDTQRRRQEAGV